MKDIGMRLTLEEYSKYFKMSKEMIQSKLKSRKLNYIIENGTTYIIVPRSSLKSAEEEKINNDKKEQSMQEKEEQTQKPTKPKTTVAMVIALYQKENQQLKEKIAYLESKIDKLIDDKEQMLRDEMNKIEQVYAKKDEQLKTILELMNTQLIAQKENKATEHEVEPIEAPSIEEDEKKEDEIVELKSYLKTLDLEPHQRKIIKKRFLAVYDKDVRIIKQNGKLYLNFSKYDYSDLLEY
jgi:hypothetical protein